MKTPVRSARWAALRALGFCVCFLPVLRAQQQNQRSPPTPVTARSEAATDKTLVFSATDPQGKFVANLQQQDLVLRDEHGNLLRIVRLAKHSDLPLRLGLMIDTSSSMRMMLDSEERLVSGFFSRVLHTGDRAFVEGFDIETTITQPFTDRHDLLDAGVRKLRPGGGSALYDALYLTCRNQMLSLPKDEAVRKILVVVTLGDDDSSRMRLEESLLECRRAATIIYAISTNLSPSKNGGDDALRKMAGNSGRALFVSSLDKFPDSFRAVEEELQNQYQLTYSPSDAHPDGSFHLIDLKTVDPRYVVRFPAAYVPPK